MSADDEFVLGETQADVAAMVSRLAGVLQGRPTTVGLYAIGVILGQAAAQAHQPDLDGLIERLYPLAQCELQRTLRRWAEEDMPKP